MFSWWILTDRGIILWIYWVSIADSIFKVLLGGWHMCFIQSTSSTVGFSGCKNQEPLWKTKGLYWNSFLQVMWEWGRKFWSLFTPGNLMEGGSSHLLIILFDKCYHIWRKWRKNLWFEKLINIWKNNVPFKSVPLDSESSNTQQQLYSVNSS